MDKLFVEPVDRVYACCDTLITAQDVASASRFQNERRRREHLAWRRIVRRELGRDVDIDYNAVGAPVVSIPNIYISVAHAGEMVAVAISDRRVGVDIERADRDFSRAASRYMSAAEAALATHDRWAGEVWCAKEAMYKYYGKQGVDLLDDLHVESYDGERGILVGRMVGMESVEVEISDFRDNFIVARAVSR